jgi:hypothetical protein
VRIRASTSVVALTVVGRRGVCARLTLLGAAVPGAARLEAQDSTACRGRALAQGARPGRGRRSGTGVADLSGALTVSTVLGWLLAPWDKALIGDCDGYVGALGRLQRAGLIALHTLDQPIPYRNHLGPVVANKLPKAALGGHLPRLADVLACLRGVSVFQHVSR